MLHTLGRAEEALSDAEAAIRCRPEWAKGYFRRAMALISLGRFEDALVSLLQCAVLEEPDSLRSIKDEITKVSFPSALRSGGMTRPAACFHLI